METPMLTTTVMKNALLITATLVMVIMAKKRLTMNMDMTMEGILMSTNTLTTIQAKTTFQHGKRKQWKAEPMILRLRLLVVLGIQKHL
mmetsp:Transcript_24355/g.45056  ORF Transcript_24355/g.45056 Transcript_24355/m.45056 type:complete len:88 (-) Transcript_24355:1011-1274(-)